MTDHDLLIRIDERTMAIHLDQKSIHKRVKNLEIWRWLLAGGGFVLASKASGILAILGFK